MVKTNTIRPHHNEEEGEVTQERQEVHNNKDKRGEARAEGKELTLTSEGWQEETMAGQEGDHSEGSKVTIHAEDGESRIPYLQQSAGGCPPECGWSLAGSRGPPGCSCGSRTDTVPSSHLCVGILYTHTHRESHYPHFTSAIYILNYMCVCVFMHMCMCAYVHTTDLLLIVVSVST